MLANGFSSAFDGHRVREQARSYEKQKARAPMKVRGLHCEQ
ncbi:hypothetical protein [Pseudomonas nitroreducens]|nr:hypothetical protein [Pseudomonas nitroreducens]